jgi:hypothetical protein
MRKGGLVGGYSRGAEGVTCHVGIWLYHKYQINRLNQNYWMPKQFQQNQINEFHWRKTKPQNMSEISLTFDTGKHGRS